MSGPDPPGPPAPGLRERRTGLVAVLFVLGCLVALGAWVAVGDARPAPQRTSSTQGALKGPSAGPTWQPSTRPGSVTVHGRSRLDGPLARVGWATLDYPLTCRDTGESVRGVWLGDVDGDAAAEAAVSVRCDAGAGSPPNGLYAYDGRPGGLRLLGELLRPADDVLLGAVRVAKGRIAATGTTYSSAGVPRCCPDERFAATWSWDGERFERRG